jgi:catechol 2,3-dioxygenase-like lactoylglutathione lyase family enzyme
MLNHVEALLCRYDTGQMSRRELIGTATQLNHATLYVNDVARSQEFYQKLFGMPVLTRQSLGVNLRAGAGFVGLYPARDRGAPRIDHICLSIDRFDATGVLAKLQAQQLNAEIVRRGETEELYVDDPDGISIQIQDTRYRGGTGRLGDRDPP